jgi:hypothetical protein
MLSWRYGIEHDDTVDRLQRRIEYLHDAICGRNLGATPPQADRVIAAHARRTCTLPDGKPARWAL